MTYRVAFAKRFRTDGQESQIDPTADLDVYLPDGVVVEKNFVERLESMAQHNQEVLDEDDAFLGRAGTEVWEYEIVNDRASEFEDALKNSQTVMEFEVIDAEMTEQDEAADEVPHSDTESNSQDQLDYDRTVRRPGVRTGDSGSGIDDLTIVSADDPRLGLTR